MRKAFPCQGVFGGGGGGGGGGGRGEGGGGLGLQGFFFFFLEASRHTSRLQVWSPYCIATLKNIAEVIH